MTPYYITAPIYYVNDIPHIGSAYTTIACDLLARFHRLDGKEVRFLTGTDEHGQKVDRSAQQVGILPQDFVDKISENFRKILPVLTISNDDFIRTTESRHKTAVQFLWKKLLEKGFIYKGLYAGWYAIRDEAFYQESELVERKAPTGSPVEWIEESSYFFKLSSFQKPLLDYYHSHSDFILPESRKNEVIKFVEQGLEDLSISRTTFKWGIPVPNDSNHIIYVWLDALTNYISALDYPQTESALFQKFWPYTTHIIGKDILRFHAIYWPAFLMAADLPLPKRIFAHGWLTHQKTKISKSLGNAIDPYALIEKFGVDPVRYFLMREIPFGNDGDFSEQALINRMNSDLVNDLGNLVQRTLRLIQKNCQGKIPIFQDLLTEDLQILDYSNDLLSKLREDIEIQALHKYCEKIGSLITKTNQYIDYQKPWALKVTHPTRFKTILAVLAEVIKIIGILLQPVIPLSAHKILDQLGVDPLYRTFEFINKPLKTGIELSAPIGIFPRYTEV